MALGLVKQIVQTVGIPVLIDPIVVVHPCAEGIELRSEAIDKHLLTTVGEAVDATVGIVELHAEIFSTDPNSTVCLADVNGCIVVLNR